MFVMLPKMTTQFYQLVHQLHCGIFRGSRWPNGLGIRVCLLRRRSWVRFMRRRIPQFFLSHYLLFNCNTLGWQTVRSVCLCIEQSIPSVFTCSCTGCMVPYTTQLHLYAEDMIQHQVIDLLFRFPCQVYRGVCNVPMTTQLYP